MSSQYVIVSRFRTPEDEMKVRGTYGPYSSKEEAERANTELINFPTPEYNLIVPLWMDDVAELQDQAFLDRLVGIATDIRLAENFEIVIDRDGDAGRFFVQIKCWRMDVITKEMGYGYGGKAYLSPHASDSELVQTIFGLYKGYWEHEARESFMWRGRRVFGPHIATEALWDVAKRVDVRSVKHTEDTPEPQPDVLPDENLWSKNQMLQLRSTAEKLGFADEVAHWDAELKKIDG